MKFFSWLWSWFGGPAAPAPAFVNKVQAETVKYCGFLPQATSVAAIIGAMTGQAAAAATAMGVASTICKAVTAAKPLMLTGAALPPTVFIDGKEIVIEGEFIK